MRARLRFAFVVVCAVAATAGIPGIPAIDDRPTLEILLDRAAWYLDYFIDQFENVVAEESYVQDATTQLPTYPVVGGRGAVPLPSPSEIARARHRDLRSDFLLVKSPDTSALVP